MSRISNASATHTAEKAIETVTLILIALLLLSGYLLYRSILVTYYTFTEKK